MPKSATYAGMYKACCQRAYRNEVVINAVNARHFTAMLRLQIPHHTCNMCLARSWQAAHYDHDPLGTMGAFGRQKEICCRTEVDGWGCGDAWVFGLRAGCLCAHELSQKETAKQGSARREHSQCGKEDTMRVVGA